MICLVKSNEDVDDLKREIWVYAGGPNFLTPEPYTLNPTPLNPQVPKA